MVERWLCSRIRGRKRFSVRSDWIRLSSKPQLKDIRETEPTPPCSSIRDDHNESTQPSDKNENDEDYFNYLPMLPWPGCFISKVIDSATGKVWKPGNMPVNRGSDQRQPIHVEVHACAKSYGLCLCRGIGNYVHDARTKNQ